MACEVKTFGKILAFNKVQEYFGLSHDENWLNSIISSISPAGEVIALGQGEKLAFLSSQFSTSYSLSWCGELEDPIQIITAILCLPIYGKNATPGNPEWSCCVLGLNSGMIVFYTDTGHKIYSQSFHDSPVLYIKCYSPPRHSEADSILYIVYDQCVCFIKCADLIPILNGIQLTLVKTYSRRNVPLKSSSITPTADTIQYHKFKFTRDRDTTINDAVMSSLHRQCTYDHIIEKALTFGYHARVTESPAQSSLVLGVGAEPYLGFYYAEEGYKTTSLGGVAKDVIGLAYKNFIGNIFKRNAPTPTPAQQDEAQSPSKEIQMRTRCRLYDGKRDGFTIALSPCGRLAAATDNLDRVMLIDSQNSVILRVWKGYRDAQCAFVPIKEKLLKGVHTHRRHALFLVIYAPRLGCLEIWALQHGPKVAAFTVSKSGQLTYNTHSLLGIPENVRVKPHITHCLFLDPSDGSVKEVQIPFHYALSESNSKTSRDIHLLRRLKSLLRFSDDPLKIIEIEKIAGDFQTLEIRQQCIEVLKKNKQLKPEIFQIIIDAFSRTLATTDETTPQQTEEHLNFINVIENYQRLTRFFMNMQNPLETAFYEPLELYDCDLVTINQLVLLLGHKAQLKEPTTQSDSMPNNSKVTFDKQLKNVGDFIEYLSIFQINQYNVIPLRKDTAHMFGYISGRLFGEFFERGLNFEEFKLQAEDTLIPKEDLLILALNFYLEKPFEYQNCDEVLEDMSRLAAMIRAICEIAGDLVNYYKYNEISSWWQPIREMLLESPNALGLLVAVVCKTVASNLGRSYHEGSCDEASANEDEEHWERISQDEAQWVLLISKLEDIAVLAAILEYPLKSVEPIMPELPYKKADCSLKAIVTGGKGIVTDLTAQWLINSRIHPSKIIEPTTIEPTQDNDDIKNENSTETDVKKETATSQVADTVNIETVLQKLALLRQHFPFSLESGILLSLMSWQYMVHWSKNLQSIEYMHATLKCLAEYKEADYALKHGICCMLWNATLKYPLQNTAKLIQKVGRLPKDKMCQQDIEMSAADVPEFLQLSLEFLKQFTESLEHNRRDLKFEETLTEGPLPLQFLALQQHHAIKELLQIHYELCTVLHFIAFFQLKYQKPLSTLFDAMSNKSFFTDINKELNYVLTAPDLVLQQHREEFLCKVISASMETIREDLENLYVKEHMEAMKKVDQLANSWKMNKMGLRKRQVIEMYAHGYDAHGELLLRDIIDDEQIGSLLLPIAGQRLSLYSQIDRDVYMKIASIGKDLLHYLDHLDANKTNGIKITATDPTDIEIVDLAKLATNIYECLSKRESKQLHIAAQMFDACCVLQES